MVCIKNSFTGIFVMGDGSFNSRDFNAQKMAGGHSVLFVGGYPRNTTEENVRTKLKVIP